MRPLAGCAFAALASSILIATSPASPQTETYTVSLSGAAETSRARSSGGTGDLDGSGEVTISIDASRRQVCYDFDVDDVATPMMAHIHRAPALRNGPTVVTLFTGLGADLDDCVPWTPKQLAAIVAEPANYYVSIYTTEFPDGALRGQLG